MAVYPPENPVATAELATDSATLGLDPVAEPYKPKKKTRRSRRGAYRRKRQEQKRLAAEAQAAAGPDGAGCDTSTTCTESDASVSETTSPCGSPTRSNTSTSQQTCARNCNNRNRRKNHNRNMNLRNNIPYYVWGPQPMYYGYNHPNMYAYHEESSLSSGGGGYAPRQRYFGNYPPMVPRQVRIQVETLSKEQQEKYVALDCEMVGIGCDGLHSALAHVTIIDWHGNAIMDEYVKQEQEVTDYRTFVSGITKEMLDQATLDFTTCRQRVQEMLKGKILVGHALNNDLGVLNIQHPWHMIRDTARYEPFMKVRFNDGVLWPRALRDLCIEKLNRNVQVYGKPHSPYEDALAALDLYQTVWQSWEKYMEYKMHKARAIVAWQKEHAAVIENKLKPYAAVVAAAK